MLPRLTAEESLEAAQRTAVGRVTLKADDRRQIQRRWQSQAGSRPRAVRAPSVEDLARIGVAVTRVPKKGRR